MLCFTPYNLLRRAKTLRPGLSPPFFPMEPSTWRSHDIFVALIIYHRAYRFGALSVLMSALVFWLNYYGTARLDVMTEI